MNFKLIADVMLGRLAKWLRILGIDTAYNQRYSDKEIIYLANYEKRFVLTRDIALLKTIGDKKCLLIKSSNVFDQICQVIKELDLKIDEAEFFSRCPICNSELSSTSKSFAEKKVPPYVLEIYNEFKYCKVCDKCFWKGTHKDRIILKIREINKKENSPA